MIFKILVIIILLNIDSNISYIRKHIEKENNNESNVIYDFFS
jgi:hypothetical protein